MFDLQADPGEQTNLILDGVPDVLRPIYQVLRDKLITMEARWGTPGMIVWRDFLKMQPLVVNPDHKTRNAQLPRWPRMLPETECAQLNDLYQEVLDAVQNEPTVKLSNLDLSTWQKNCSVPQAIIDRIRKENR